MAITQSKIYTYLLKTLDKPCLSIWNLLQFLAIGITYFLLLDLMNMAILVWTLFPPGKNTYSTLIKDFPDFWVALCGSKIFNPYSISRDKAR